MKKDLRLACWITKDWNFQPFHQRKQRCSCSSGHIYASHDNSSDWHLLSGWRYRHALLSSGEKILHNVEVWNFKWLCIYCFNVELVAVLLLSWWSMWFCYFMFYMR